MTGGERRSKPAVVEETQSPAVPAQSATAQSAIGQSAIGARRVLSVLLLAALITRVAAVLATGGFAASHSVLYEGDVSVWLEALRSAATGQAFELGLPVRPPGTRALVEASAAVSASGEVDLTLARGLWVLLGALTAPVWYLALRPLGARVAVGAGVLTALGGGLVQLSLTPNSEVPYLLLVAVSVGLLTRRWPQRGVFPALGFGALQGLGCLLRVEHLLATGLWAAWLGWSQWSASGRRRAGVGAALLAPGAVLCGVFLTTLPHNLAAHRSIQGFQARGPAPNYQALRWSPEARAELEALPRFLQASMARVVEVNLAHRMQVEVRAGDLATFCDDAFGWQPASLPSPVFIALYGPLNFRLANGPENTDGGFTRAALDQPPALRGGRERYAPVWLRSLPAGGELAFEYPGHLQMVCDGYGLGLQWLLEQPGEWLRLVARKLGVAWAGTAHGFGGGALPFGPAGLRRRVDLTVPQGSLAAAWRIALLLAVLSALVVARRRWREDLAPLGLWSLALLAVTVGFFGYARMGAMLAPVLGAALAAALPSAAAHRLGRGLQGLPLWAWCVVLMVVVDAGQWLLVGDSPLLNGQAAGAPGDFAEDVQVTFR